MHRKITGRLVIATHNPGKLVEMRDLLARYGIEAVSAGELETARAGRNRYDVFGECAAEGRGRRAGIRASGIRR